MAAFVTSEKLPPRWSRLTAYASVTVNEIGVFLLPLKTLFLSFLRQYSLFLDNFFSDERKYILKKMVPLKVLCNLNQVRTI